MNLQILDCTIRDGGYYNNWDFSNEIIEKYCKKMKELPIDLLEVGYRSIHKDEYYGKHFYSPDFIVSRFCHELPTKKLVIMLNEKDTKPADLGRLLHDLESKISIIRLAVAPDNLERSIVLANEIKQSGFGVGLNLMYMSKYCNEVEFIKRLLNIDHATDYIFVVDSYGGMNPTQVSKLIRQIKLAVNDKIKIGFHGHNNLELAFANSLAAINAGCDVIDCSLCGMGRGAGNLKTELLLTYLASNGICEIDFNILSELVETWSKLHSKYLWGSNLSYMVSGANSLPQKDVMDWVTKRFYSLNSIVRALNNQKEERPDNIKLPILEKNQTYHNALIVGGGPSAIEHVDAIKRFLLMHDDICIIHASSKNAWAYEELDVPQYYCLVGNEGHRLEKVFNDLNRLNGVCVLPPYPRKMGTYIPGLLEAQAHELEQIEFTDVYQDSHTAIAFQTALDLKIQCLYLVGYDGYDDGQIDNKERDLVFENETMFHLFSRLNDRFYSLTPTHYKNLKVVSVYKEII